MIGWTVTATASGVWGLVQFYTKFHRTQVTGEDFYTAYVGSRITGFESHWMTFGALQLSVLLLLLAHWFFSSRRLPGWALPANKQELFLVVYDYFSDLIKKEYFELMNYDGKRYF